MQIFETEKVMQTACLDVTRSEANRFIKVFPNDKQILFLFIMNNDFTFSKKRYFLCFNCIFVLHNTCLDYFLGKKI